MSKKIQKEFEQYAQAVGVKIKEIRESKNLTRENMDEHPYKIPVRTLADVELGTTNPTLKNLWLISKRLEVDVRDLLKI